MGKAFKISDYYQPEERSTMDHMEITPIPIQMIDINWKNFYSVDWQELDLAESIKVSGLLTPLGVVAGPGGRWKLISGHRRLKAVKYLHDSEPDGRERWSTVPCVVYDSPEDADREELMLIHANAQRIKSGAEISKEAEKITEILTRMKENGLELPGRMRNRVAEALKVSSTRLARLDAIKNNLTYPGWQRAWEKQEINEAVAYRLSQLDYSQQMNAADWVIDHHIKHKDLTVKHIEDALAHPPLTNPGCADPLAYEEDPVKVDRELVRRGGFLDYFSGARFANRKDGMDQLKITFRHAGHASSELEWDGDPKGIRFRKPVEWLLGWGAMYDALAANALDAAIEAATTEPPKAPLVKLKESAGGASPAPTREPMPDPMTAPTVTVSGALWRRCLEDPPKGWTLAFMFDAWGDDQLHDCDLSLVQFHNGKWYGVYGESDEEVIPDDCSWWLPAAPIPAEVWG